MPVGAASTMATRARAKRAEREKDLEMNCIVVVEWRRGERSWRILMDDYVPLYSRSELNNPFQEVRNQSQSKLRAVLKIETERF